MQTICGNMFPFAIYLSIYHMLRRFLDTKEDIENTPDSSECTVRERSVHMARCVCRCVLVCVLSPYDANLFAPSQLWPGTTHLSHSSFHPIFHPPPFAALCPFLPLRTHPPVRPSTSFPPSLPTSNSNLLVKLWILYWPSLKTGTCGLSSLCHNNNTHYQKTKLLSPKPFSPISQWLEASVGPCRPM